MDRSEMMQKIDSIGLLVALGFLLGWLAIYPVIAEIAVMRLLLHIPSTLIRGRFLLLSWLVSYVIILVSIVAIELMGRRHRQCDQQEQSKLQPKFPPAF